MEAQTARGRRPRGVVLAAVVAVVAILVFLAVLLLSESSPRRLGTNDALLTLRLHIPPDRQLCQPTQVIPAGTGFITFFPNSDGRRAGPLRLTVRDASGARIAATTPTRAYGPAPMAVRIPTVRRKLTDAKVCVVNRGESLIAIFGAVAGEPSAQLPRGQKQPFAYVKVRFDYVSADSKSWVGFAPRLARRFGYVKATFFGSWTMWLALVALLVVCLGAVLYAGRELSRCGACGVHRAGCGHPCSSRS